MPLLWNWRHKKFAFRCKYKFALPLGNSSKNDEVSKEGWILPLAHITQKKKTPRFLGGLVGGGNTHSSSSSLSLKNKVWGGKR